MKRSVNLRPLQLILVSIAGLVISVASLSLIPLVHTTGPCGCIVWIRVLLILSPFVAGLVLIFTASGSLKKGIANQQWPAEQIEPLRSWLESPYSNALTILFAVSYLVLSFPHSRFRPLGLPAFLLAMLFMQLRNAVRRPPAKPNDTLPSWRDYLAPIHSDHWGNR